MKKSERKDCYSKIAIAMNKGENKKAYEMLRDIASSEGLFILTEYKCADLALLEALEELMSEFEAYAERIDSEVGRLRDFDRIISDGDAPECYNKARAAIAAARGNE